LVAKALRFRKMLGGGMRQAGVIAAGALYALEHNRGRIADDHAAAQRLAGALRAVDGVTVGRVDSNIVNVDVACDADLVVTRAADRGVLFSAIGPRRMRLVTHLDVVGPAFDQCIERVVEAHREALREA
jgi:threonine aldolase